LALCVTATVVFVLFVTVLASLARGEASLSHSDTKWVGNAGLEVVLLLVLGCSISEEDRYVPPRHPLGFKGL